MLKAPRTSSWRMPEPPCSTSGMPVASASLRQVLQVEAGLHLLLVARALETAPWMLPMATESQSQPVSRTKRAASSGSVKPLPEANSSS